LGRHFRNALEVGYAMGTQVAAYLVEHTLTPMR
jgi:hypothetical protein